MGGKCWEYLSVITYRQFAHKPKKNTVQCTEDIGAGYRVGSFRVILLCQIYKPSIFEISIHSEKLQIPLDLT